ncbi:hypothetical protein BD413DRAFT_89100 [Trametes elegans]|nr:hypothetical protein BD413DRAFT_89100 [Trametes elegans]
MIFDGITCLSGEPVESGLGECSRKAYTDRTAGPQVKGPVSTAPEAVPEAAARGQPVPSNGDDFPSTYTTFPISRSQHPFPFARPPSRASLTMPASVEPPTYWSGLSYASSTRVVDTARRQFSPQDTALLHRFPASLYIPVSRSTLSHCFWPRRSGPRRTRTEDTGDVPFPY